MVSVQTGLCLIDRELIYLTDPVEKRQTPKYCVIGGKTASLVHFILRAPFYRDVSDNPKKC